MLPIHHGDNDKRRAPLRLGVLSAVSNWFRQVLSNQQTWNLFMFLLVNLTFATVELAYGLWTNSLGLIGDSFHMYFDCSALLFGLIAAVIARKPSNERYTFGYGRAEVLGGFLNGLFLIFIAYYVLEEAIEVHTHRLLLVAVLGFIVNLIGIFAFQHGGHGHSHGGGGGCGHAHGFSSKPAPPVSHHDSHGHGHDSHGHDGHGHDSHGHGHGAAMPTHVTISEDNHGHGYGHEKHGNGHDSHGHDSHSHGHGGHGGHGGHHNDHGPSHNDEGGRSFVMDGVLLHILADTLGSVGVIISSTLIHFYGMMIADPICSIFIAVLIGLSVMPLMRDSIAVLMQRTPRDLEAPLLEAYQKINHMEGVVSYRNARFWSLTGAQTFGSIVVVIKHSTNDSEVLKTLQNLFSNIGVADMTIQLERF